MDVSSINQLCLRCVNTWSRLNALVTYPTQKWPMATSFVTSPLSSLMVSRTGRLRGSLLWSSSMRWCSDWISDQFFFQFYLFNFSYRNSYCRILYVYSAPINKASDRIKKSMINSPNVSRTRFIYIFTLTVQTCLILYTIQNLFTHL